MPREAVFVDGKVVADFAQGQDYTSGVLDALEFVLERIERYRPKTHTDHDEVLDAIVKDVTRVQKRAKRTSMGYDRC